MLIINTNPISSTPRVKPVVKKEVRQQPSESDVNRKILIVHYENRLAQVQSVKIKLTFAL